MENFNSEVDFFGELGIIALKSCRELGEKINQYLIADRRKAGISCPGSFLIPLEEIRFTNGEGKVKLTSTARAKDVFVIGDIGNYSCTYDLYGYENHMGPDEHFQDIKRTLSALGGKAKRTSVIMPLLYASRQDKRKGRESLDCAMALQDLERLGVKNIISFDVHEPKIQNAVPLISFENLYATYEIVKAFIDDEHKIMEDKNSLLIISPDTGAMDRAIYYSSVMDIDVGLFYKRRDFSRVVDGRNPIVQHEYLGRPVKGKNIIIIDDIISTGETILDIVCELKRLEAAKIFIASTFSLFSKGEAKFEEYFEKGLINKVYSTNLTYVPDRVKAKPWFKAVDMSGYLAAVINNLNSNRSIEPVIDSTEKLKADILAFRK